jgi:hypothetical protein
MTSSNRQLDFWLAELGVKAGQRLGHDSLEVDGEVLERRLHLRRKRAEELCQGDAEDLL